MNILKYGVIWILLIIIVVVLYSIYESRSSIMQLDGSDFLKSVEEKEVKSSVEIKRAGEDYKIRGKLKNDQAFVTTILAEDKVAEDKGLMDFLRKNEVGFEIKTSNAWKGTLLSWLPFMVLFFLLILFFRKVYNKQMEKVDKFTKSISSSQKSGKTERPQQKQKKITFENIGGAEEAKRELQEIVEFLKDPKKFNSLGAEIPKGVMLVGLPGTGKTLLAKAVAGEASVPFFSTAGSEFMEMLVGVGAARVRDLFDNAKKNAPSIIFIDEIDTIARHRGAGLGGGHDEREQTLNQIMVELDGFKTDTNVNVIVMAATNRPDILDPAFVRPGRFDRRVIVDLPDISERQHILEIHTRFKTLAKKGSGKVDLSIIAAGTTGFSGADLANVSNEAAIIAARNNKERIEMEDFEYALDKLLMGVERKSKIISPKEKKVIAFHEAGHVIIACYCPEADPIHKTSIIPRDRSLGIAQQLPLEDRHIWTEKYLLAQLAVSMGGRVAEEIIFDELSSGAASDIEKATEIARRMVCKLGMSKKLGPLAYGRKAEGSISLGKRLAEKDIKDYSEQTAREIDEEIKRIVNQSHQEAKRILEENEKQLNLLAQELLKKETLTGEEINKILKLKKLK